MSGDRIAPGPPANRDHLLAARERERLLRTELPRVRAAATAWRNSLAALLAGLIGFSLIKGRSDVSQLAAPWAVIVGVFLLGALICGTIGALSLVRAANGEPAVGQLRELLTRRSADHMEALASAKALRRGIRLTVFCTALLVTGVAVTWYGPAATPPATQIATPDTGTVCGTVVRVDHGTLLLKTKSGEVVVNLNEASTVDAVKACPAA